jgi:hypothetical protein
MLGLILQAADTSAGAIPSLSDRFNFTIPIIVILVILMFFFLLKSYTSEQPSRDKKVETRGR